MDKEELINGYFAGSLPQDQLEEFNRLLETHAEFAADFEFQKALQQSLKKDERREIKELFSGLETKENQPKTKVIQLRTWFAAASIALVVGLGSWALFFNSGNINTEQLYAANFSPYDNVVSPIERGNAIEDLRTRAFVAYEDQDYPEALQLFTDLKAEQDDPYISFYEANIRMQLNQHDMAIPILQDYIKNNGKLADRALWYLALSHLKLGDVEESKAQLAKLIELGTFKSKAAEELVIQLD